jgi:hypothetical protein
MANQSIPSTQTQPKLNLATITDPVLKQNFQNLINYFSAQNQFLGFKFFDLSYSAAQANVKVAHGLAVLPQDVVVTKIIGAGTVQFNHGLFDSANMNLTVTGACRIRFFIGTYWNLAQVTPSQVGDLTQYMSQPTSSNTTSSSSYKVPTVQKFLSGTGVYTAPKGVLYIRVRMVGGGGGGGGSGAVAGTPGSAGGTGGTTTFGTTLLSAAGGVGGGAYVSNTSPGQAGTGGSASLGTGPVGLALAGGSATGAAVSSTTNTVFGGAGGNSVFGGGGTGSSLSNSNADQAGGAGVTNTGGGGGGASGFTSHFNGPGGGAGGYVDAVITSPLSTYAWAVGAAGTAGTAGTSGAAGGLGGSGIILVEEFYQ